MAAIVTNNIKQQLLQTLLEDVQDSANSYFIGIGKADQWNTDDTPPAIVNSEKEKRDFRVNLQSIIRTTDASFVANRYNWTSGTIYNAYTDNNSTNTNYYVLTGNNRVYLCVQQAKNQSGVAQTSTVDPDNIGANLNSKKTSDGYVWKYLFTLGAVRSNKFLSANYLPVEKVDSSEFLGIIETQQLQVQKAASAGQVVGFRILNAGTGYSTGSVPNVTIVGDGFGARAVATVSNAGTISKLEVKDSEGNLAFGSGYSFANVDFDYGAARAIPIISFNGLGSDPREDLNSVSIMINSKPDGIQNGSFIVENDFRQIGLIKNPKDTLNDSDFKLTDANVLRKLTLSSVTNFDSDNSRDALIEGVTSGAKAFVDDLRGDTFFYHQNDSSGYKSFTLSETIRDVDNAGHTAIVSSDSDGLVNPFSGEVLYIENRNAVIRDAAQTEDIKLIVQL